jgi:hypothetical protein
MSRAGPSPSGTVQTSIVAQNRRSPAQLGGVAGVVIPGWADRPVVGLPWRIVWPAVTMSVMKLDSVFVRRRRALVIGFMVGLAGVTVWMLADGDRGGVIAGVLAFAVAALTLAGPMLAGLWQAVSLDDARLGEAAVDLAREVARREQAEQNLFLGDAGKAVPADVSYAPPGQVSWPVELVTWRSDRGERSGSLADIAGFYLSQRHGRLVILGAAGAGKTVLANQLLLDLVDRLLADGDGRPGRVVVPVRMSLPAFNPVVAEASAGGQVASRLDSWMARYLVDVFGLQEALARAGPGSRGRCWCPAPAHWATPGGGTPTPGRQHAGIRR